MRTSRAAAIATACVLVAPLLTAAPAAADAVRWSHLDGRDSGKLASGLSSSVAGSNLKRTGDLTPESWWGNDSSWNRYAYSLNNPVLFTDPTGEKVNVADLDSDHREMLIEELEEKSGLDLDYEDGLLVSKGEVLDENGNPTGSKTAQEDLLKAIDSDTTHFVLDRSGLDSVDMGKAVGDTVFLDFDDISGIDAGDNDPSTMDASMVFLHELEHTFGLKDPSPGVLKTTPWKKGETVERVNTMREELNLPIRGQYQSKRDKKRGHYLPFSNGRLYAPVGVK